MIKKIFSDPRFWKSVLSLGSAFIVVMVLVFWGVNGFQKSFWEERDPVELVLMCIASGLVYGVFVTYGKFWAKYKRDEQ